MSESAVRAIEAGRRPRVLADNFRALADWMGVSVERAKAELGIQQFEPVMMRRYPYFDVKIPAGTWVDTEPRSTPDGFLELPADVPRDAFVLRIFGDCMEPEYPSGSIIVFVPVRHGEEGALQFEGGRDYYFEHSDGKATFKRVFFEPQKERWKLVPLNKKYKPIFVPEQMRARLSRAVRLVRELV